jgi:5-methylcytosine-specific restriction endonuclease McrA
VSLHSLSNDTILSRIRKLARCERALTLRVLVHLNEIERRKLHLQLGYRSMFDFCTSALGYSASAAGRRIQVARAVVRFPEIHDLLQSNEVTVCTISRVAGVLTPENKDEILGRIRGRSQREAEAIAAEYQPREVLRDRVFPVAVVAPARPQTSPSPSLAQQCSETRPGVSVCTENNQPGPARAPAATHSHCGSECKDSRDAQIPQPAREEFETRVVLHFAVSKEFMANLERFRSLAWHRLPANPSLEQVFGLMMDHALAKEDPAVRRARREERTTSKRPPTEEPGRARTARTTASRARYIPARMRDQVFMRDKGRCTFVGPGGRVCGSTRALQVDHVVPVARGGTSTPGNLRLLCAYHNRLEAERIMGKSITQAGRFHAARTGVIANPGAVPLRE